MDRDTIIRLARWKPIPSFPSYDVSDCGLVKRKDRLLKQSPNVNGYPRVSLWVNGKTVSRVVHSLVAEAFIGPRPNGMQVCHSNGNKNDNRACNLRYASAKENEADKAIHGTKAIGKRNGIHTKPEARPRGSRHGHAILDEEQVMRIKKMLAVGGRGTGVLLAKEFGVSPQTIAEINRGNTWRHV